VHLLRTQGLVRRLYCCREAQRSIQEQLEHWEEWHLVLLVTEEVEVERCCADQEDRSEVGRVAETGGALVLVESLGHRVVQSTPAEEGRTVQSQDQVQIPQAAGHNPCRIARGDKSPRKREDEGNLEVRKAHLGEDLEEVDRGAKRSKDPRQLAMMTPGGRRYTD
jgi:hypothetical protein